MKFNPKPNHPQKFILELERFEVQTLIEFLLATKGFSVPQEVLREKLLLNVVLK